MWYLVALITGVDSGIGRAVAIDRAMEGADVAIVYNVPAALSQVRSAEVRGGQVSNT